MTIGLDTNILVRHYTQDDPAQSTLATDFLSLSCTENHPGWINLIVVCELAWVLRSSKSYSYSKEKLVEVLFKMRYTRGFRIEDEAGFDLALHRYENSDADFSDCLLAVRNEQHGVRFTATFDKNAAKVSGFELLTDIRAGQAETQLPENK